MKNANEKIEEILNRGVEKIIKRDDLIKKLKSGKKLRIKHGVDPTTKDLHLGYSVIYLKLKEFQEMGHQIVFLIGDFTGRFGDPTEKVIARKLRTKKEVRQMAKNYIRQVGKILDLKKLEIRYNSEWYDKMSAEELLKLMSHFTVSRMLERDMFQERMKKKLEIGLHEPVYPALQGYDSVVLKADLTVCGSDQLFNELKGRELQKDFGQIPQDIVATSLLVGTDGKRKMSQSLGNYIGFEEKPKEQYGKIMSIPDNLLENYFELATSISFNEVKRIKKDLLKGKINPRDLKAKLAREIVAIYYNKEKAIKAEKEFERIFKEKKLPSKITEIAVKKKNCNILTLLIELKLVYSKGEARRLVQQEGVKINERTENDWQKNIEIKKGMIIQAGKKRFVKIV